jgi:hypothetical protein
MMFDARLGWVASALLAGLASGAEPQARPLPQAVAKPGQASSPQRSAPPDIRFLEYLGTLEADDENWTEIAAAALSAPRSGAKVQKPQSADSTRAATEPKL